MNLYKIGFFVFGGALLFFLGILFSDSLKSKLSVGNIPVPISTITLQTIPSPTIISIPSATGVQTGVQKSDEEGIREAFALKYDRPTSAVIVTISKNNGTHAQGGVKFAGEMGGGWFLAYKSNNKWMIVQDGNGTISCETITPYNFPIDFATECVDKTGNLIKR